MDKVEEAIALIRAKPDRCHFGGPQTEVLIQSAETALGIRLPPSYRFFVSRLGAGGAGSSEIYGVTGPNFSSGLPPNGIWLTWDQRQNADFPLPNSIVIIGEDGYGGYYVLNTAKAGQDGEPPVEMWEPWHTGPVENLEVIAADFGTWLLEEVRFGLRDNDGEWEGTDAD